MEVAQTHLRWDAATREQLKALATANERSLNAELRIAIREHLDRERKFATAFDRLSRETHA